MFFHFFKIIFLHFPFFISVKECYTNVSGQQLAVLVVLYTSQYLFFHSRLTFTVSTFIAHFIEALRCINLMTSPFIISEWFQLQWLDCIQKVDNLFFTILDQEKWHFSPSAAFARKKKNEKNIWCCMDTTRYRRKLNDHGDKIQV